MSRRRAPPAATSDGRERRPVLLFRASAAKHDSHPPMRRGHDLIISPTPPPMPMNDSDPPLPPFPRLAPACRSRIIREVPRFLFDLTACGILSFASSTESTRRMPPFSFLCTFASTPPCLDLREGEEGRSADGRRYSFSFCQLYVYRRRNFSPETRALATNVARKNPKLACSRSGSTHLSFVPALGSSISSRSTLLLLELKSCCIFRSFSVGKYLLRVTRLSSGCRRVLAS
jgi:hypothetical protein